MNSSDTSIFVEFKKVGLFDSPTSGYVTYFSIIVWNKSGQQIRAKVPMTSYVNLGGQVDMQKSWGNKVNGSKGMNLLEGTFCQMELVYRRRMYPEKGDRLLVNVELGKPMGRRCFTFECTDVHENFRLFDVSEEDPPESTNVLKNSPSSMANALKRIALLEDGLSEVSIKLAAMQRDFLKLTAMNKAGSGLTLSEVLAWLAMQDRVGMAELRTRLLPLNVLTSALVDEVNELALDIVGELALEDVGSEIVVTRKILGQILGSLDVTQFKKRISS